jgi:hypothetical protein
MVSLCQLSGLTLYVEHVKCLMPASASRATSLSGLSLTVGMMGSIRAAVGMLFAVRVLMAFRRSVGGGAFGSSSFARLLFSVVIVTETIEGVFWRMSMSLVTKFDLVMIWIRQFASDRIWRHRRVRPASRSMQGYGSDELEIETVWPFSLVASRFSLSSRFFFDLQVVNLGM